MEDVPTAESFERLVGDIFRLDDGTPLTLAAVERPRGPAVERRAYTLILRGAPQPIVAEGVQRLTHDSGASYTLYMMPIHTVGTTHQDYQIVFN